MISFEFPDFLLDGERFIPYIFDGGLQESVPDSFNAVRIPLDGTLRSDLRWERALASAEQAANRGLKILWDLDLGLFSRLTLPLSDETQFRSLSLAVHHLLDLIRTRFLPVTLAVVVYRGNADLSVGFPWDADGMIRTRELEDRAVRLDCRDHGCSYLRQLIVGWPDAVQPMVLLDAGRIRQPLDSVLLTDRQQYRGFAMAVRGSDWPGRMLGWDRPSVHGLLARQRLESPTELSQPKIGLCLPSKFAINYDFSALQKCVESNRHLRLLSEDSLTSDWDGLDVILVDDTTLSPLGRRQLQGFLAAGGRVVAIDRAELIG